MADSLGELFIELGVFADTKELEQFEEKVRKVNKTMQQTKEKTDKTKKSTVNFLREIRNIGLAVGGAFYALTRLTNSLIQTNQEFLNLTRNTDIALGTFQKWNNIGRMFGIRNAAQQIASLNQRLFELKLTGEGADGFILAGINPLGQDAEGVMEQLRNRVAGLDDTAATFLLSRMGLDPTMLHLLRMTREEFEAFGKTTEKYRLTEEQSKQLQKMNAQLEIAKIKFQYLKDRAILAILPHCVRFMNVIANIGDIIRNFLNFLDGDSSFAKFIKFIIKAAAIFTVWVTTVSTLAKTFQILSVAITAARVALLALTSHPIIAALTAVAGLIMWGVNKYQEKHGTGIYNGVPNVTNTNQNIDNRRLSNVHNNPNITMNNTIHTTEAARSINNELMAYNQYYAYGFTG